MANIAGATRWVGVISTWPYPGFVRGEKIRGEKSKEDPKIVVPKSGFGFPYIYLQAKGYNSLRTVAEGEFQRAAFGRKKWKI